MLFCSIDAFVFSKTSSTISFGTAPTLKKDISPEREIQLFKL